MAKRISKRQLRADKFVDAAMHYGELIRSHQREVLGGVVVLVLLVVLATWAISAMQGRGQVHREAFSASLATLAQAMDSGTDADYELALAEFEDLESSAAGKAEAEWAVYFQGYCQEQLNDFLAAEESFQHYLELDPGGEFALPARLGIASANAGVGRFKRQADLLLEVAALPGASEGQARNWRWRAAEIYMAEGYYDDATALLEEIAASDDPMLSRRAETSLKALAARGS